MVVLGLVSIQATAQKYKAQNGYVKFFSDAVLEDITAETNKGSSVVDWSTGDIVFSIPITSFEFDKSLMKEHFNEKYMESDKYPKATFSGSILGLKDTEGKQLVTAEGDLMIHGISRKVKTKGEINRSQGRISLQSEFIVRLEDHKVKIPQLLWQNIAEEVQVTINFNYDKLQQ